jgi:hypothetical protein
MEQLLDIVTIVCIGLMVGTEFAVSAFVGPILEKLESPAKAQATRLFARTLGAIMPFWYGVSLLLLAAEAVMRHNQWGFGLLMTSCAIWALAILLSVLVLVPINNRVAKMDSVFSENLQREHRQWDVLHRWRVFALGVALVCLCVGIGV